MNTTASNKDVFSMRIAPLLLVGVGACFSVDTDICTTGVGRGDTDRRCRSEKIYANGLRLKLSEE